VGESGEESAAKETVGDTEPGATPLASAGGEFWLTSIPARNNGKEAGREPKKGQMGICGVTYFYENEFRLKRGQPKLNANEEPTFGLGAKPTNHISLQYFDQSTGTSL